MLRKQAELDDLDNVVQESPRVHALEQLQEGHLPTAEAAGETP